MQSSNNNMMIYKHFAAGGRKKKKVIPLGFSCIRTLYRSFFFFFIYILFAFPVSLFRSVCPVLTAARHIAMFARTRGFRSNDLGEMNGPDAYSGDNFSVEQECVVRHLSCTLVYSGGSENISLSFPGEKKRVRARTRNVP